MGRRSRAAGVTNAAVRAARRAWQAQDDEAAALAQRVYNIVREAEHSGEAGEIHPLLWAPLVVAAEMGAQVIVRANRLDAELADDVAAYLVAGLLAGVQGFDFEHFEAWRKQADAVTHDEGSRQ